MELRCADCGCLVDGGVIATPCDGHPDCCCRDLAHGRLAECWCCGVERDPSVLTALHHRKEVTICEACVGSLAERVGRLDVTPILPVADMATAAAFYEAAGFSVRLHESSVYAFVHYDEQSVFDLSLQQITPAANQAGCYIITDDAIGWHSRLSAAALPVSPVEDQPWGMREFTLTDPSGNRLRIATSLSAQPDAGSPTT